MKGSWVRVPFSAFFFCLKMPPDSILTAFLLYCNIFFYCFLETVFFHRLSSLLFSLQLLFLQQPFCTFLLWCCLAGGLFGSCRFLRCYCQFLRLFARCAGKTATPSAGSLKVTEYSLSSQSACLQVFALTFTIPCPPYSLRSLLKISLYFP